MFAKSLGSKHKELSLADLNLPFYALRVSVRDLNQIRNNYASQKYGSIWLQGKYVLVQLTIAGDIVHTQLIARIAETGVYS